jgi:DNA-binding transcriptional ArsR family regulator
MSQYVVCPKCGQPFDISDHRVRKLTPAAFDAWHKWEPVLKRGERLGASRAGRLVSMTPSAARKHLERLRAVGLVEAVKKRQGGTYHVYQRVA